MLITRAPWSTAQRIARDSARTEIERSAATTFATTSSTDGPRPAMPMPLSQLGRDHPGHDRPVPLRVVRGAADEAPRRDDAARQLGVPAVDARVDHGHPDRGERRQHRPQLERARPGEVPLLDRERIGRGQRPRGGDRPASRQVDGSCVGAAASARPVVGVVPTADDQPSDARETDDERAERRHAASSSTAIVTGGADEAVGDESELERRRGAQRDGERAVGSQTRAAGP